MKPLAMPPEIKADFLKRVPRSRTIIIEDSNALDARRKQIFLGVQADVRARRAAERTALASLFRRFDELHRRVGDALTAHHASAALVTEVDQLRAEWLAACRQRGGTVEFCLSGPVGHPLTRDLVLLGAALDDDALADVERLIELRSGPRHETVLEEVHLVIEAALDAEAARHGAWQEASSRLISHAEMVKQFGDPPPLAPQDIASARNTVLSSGKPRDAPEREDLRELYRTDTFLRSARSDKLAELIPEGLVTKLRFPSVTYRPMKCRTTNRIHRILNDGTVVYAEECEDLPGGPKVREVIFAVPTPEVEGLKPGDEVEVVVNGAGLSGHVGRIYKDAGHKTIARIRHIVF